MRAWLGVLLHQRNPGQYVVATSGGAGRQADESEKRCLREPKGTATRMIHAKELSTGLAFEFSLARHVCPTLGIVNQSSYGLFVSILRHELELRVEPTLEQCV